MEVHAIMQNTGGQEIGSDFFNSLFIATALETYQMILVIDQDAGTCTTLLTSQDGFVQAGPPVPSEVKHQEVMDSIHPDERDQVTERWGQDLEGAGIGSSFSTTFRSNLMRKDGRYGWWTVHGRMLEMGGHRVVVVLYRDVSDEMRERQQLMARGERDGLTALFNRSKLTEMLEGRYRELKSCGVIFLDLNGLKDANDNFGHDVGDQMIGMVARSLLNLERTGITPYRYGGDEFLLIAENLDREELSQVVQRWLQGWKDQQSHSELNCSIAVGITWEAGDVDVPALIERADADMYRNKHLMKAGILPELSSYESNQGVVGLYGRQDFFKVVRMLLDGSDDRRYYMVSLSIGHFPLINIWFGRDTGDRVLARVGERIRAFAKEQEGLGCFLENGRFALLLPADEELVRRLSRELNAILGQFSPCVGFRPTIGVYPITDKALKVFTMLDYAGEAQGRVGDNASDRVAFHDPKLLSVDTLQNTLLGDMKTGLETGELDFWLQPVCDPANGRVLAAEVLARWNHPSWGLLEPGRFIPALEAGGLTAELDPVLWRKTAAQLRVWLDRGLKPIPVTVNVSRSDILSLDVVDFFSQLAEEYELEHRLLQAVISAEAMRGGRETELAILALRQAGFSVVMDVSLSPRASLGGIPLPSDKLKVDLQAMPDWASSDRELLLQLLARARELGKPMMIAGVETAKQVELLWGLNPDGVQGFRYYRPMPIAEFSALLEKE